MNGTSVSQQSKLKRLADAPPSENRTSDNKYSINDGSVMLHYHLDWFEASIWSDSEHTDFLIDEIKKYLSFATFKESFGNSRYYDSLISVDFGIHIFYNTRPKVANAPVYIELSGTFFRHAISASFINFLLILLRIFNIKWVPARIDASVDFISFSEKAYVPEPDFINRFTPYEKHFDIVVNAGVPKMYSFGRDGARLTVYNKLKDDRDKEFLSRHPEYTGCSGVWRLEFQFRRSELKTVFRASPSSFADYDSIYRLVLGQCFRRYTFEGFKFEPSSISSYLRKSSTDEGSMLYYERKTLANFRKLKQYEKLIYSNAPRKYVSVPEMELQERFFHNMDFYYEVKKYEKND